MTQYFLVLVLAGATTVQPVSTHPTWADCRQRLAAEIARHAASGRAVEFVTCQPHQVPELRAPSREIVTR